MRIFASPIIIAIFMAPLFAGRVYSADVTLNINGDIVAAPCSIDNSGQYSIDLGQNIPTRQLSEASSSSSWKTFNVTLSNCPVGTSSVTALFSGPVDVADSELYANSTGTGYAGNVGIELQRITGSLNAGNGKKITVNIGSNRSAIFDMRARVFSRMGGATPGIINSVVLLNFTYN